MQTQGYKLDEFRVLSITSNGRWGWGRVMAMNSRWGTDREGVYHENWSFHIVALYRGKVYDFSFNQAPKVLSFNDYIKEMLVPKNPFMPYGSSFRIAGQGPYLTRQIAKQELEQLRFKVMKYHGSGVFETVSKNLTLSDFNK